MSFDLLVDLHKGNARQGPGGDGQTRLAMALAGLSDVSRRLRIADIGCGTGSSTLVLAENPGADITAIDLIPAFLEVLSARAGRGGFSNRVATLACPMDDLPFEENSLDVIWSEGAIYNMGFEKGARYFRRFLTSGGILAVSEITWLTQDRPEELARHWTKEYPEIASAAEKIRVLEELGYALTGYFPLPESCWLENYYDPLEKGFASFLVRHQTDEARSIIDAEMAEIALYKKYHDHIGYGFYVARKV
ncbi:MAG: class I SAM-dependent methyltransferase [Alphaproteobacteria bacterium]|nr:class I SAM-dependent methyltransferase [Alphaproteobacteria bacterium]